MSLAHKDTLWKIGADDFVGPNFISGAFSVDGLDEEFEHILEWEDFGSPLFETERSSRTQAERRSHPGRAVPA